MIWNTLSSTHDLRLNKKKQQNEKNLIKKTDDLYQRKLIPTSVRWFLSCMHKQFIPMGFRVFDFSIPIFDYEIYSLFHCAAYNEWTEKKNTLYWK